MIRVIALITPIFLLTGCLSQRPVPAYERGSQARVQPMGPGYYTVKRGDTLYRIAHDNGVDVRDVAAWNSLGDSTSIKEGQVLRIAPPSGTTEGVKPVIASPVVEERSLDATSQNGSLKREPKVGKEPYSDEAYARLNKIEEPAKTEAPITAESKPETPPAGADDVPWIWPVPGAVTAPFSEAANKGLNFAGKAGAPVVAAGDGKVVYAGSGLRGYGELVIVKHNTVFLSAYAHNRKILVKEGQQVSRGQKIAEMGDTGTDSVKLHFEIRKQGKPVDPAQYLPKR